MTWPPEPQPACTEPCCTGGDLHAPTPERVPLPAQLRACGVAGCTSCPPATRWTPGGGDRLPNSTYRKASS